MLPDPIPNTVSSNFVRAIALSGHIGELVENNKHDEIEQVTNSQPQTEEVRTLTLGGGFSAGTDYVATLLGFLITYTSIAADTDQNGVADSYAAAINDDPNLRGQVTASTTGASAVVTLTANLPGTAFTLVSGALTTAALVTSAAEASDIPFGRLVLFTGFGQQIWDELGKQGKIADSSQLVAQVDTLQVLTYSAASSVVVIIRDENGHVVSDLTVAHNTNVNTTAGDIEAALDADLTLVALGIIASSATDTVTLTASTAGQTFTLESFVVGGTGTQALTTTKGTGTSLKLSARGVARRRMDIEAATVGDSSTVAYRPGNTVDVIRSGLVFVEIDSTETLPAFGGVVYVDLTAGAQAGRFYTIAAAGRQVLSGASWCGSTNDGLGLLDINLAA